ncbi:hypothetical protein BGX21_009498 [Mortierella sp. AD011]|nr:hypothetical protein BGX21_009498 [Mortierella sp. AD011]
MTTTPLSTISREQIKDRILGCLFGNAVGDAYGLATEFMSKSTAHQCYGNGPIAFGTDPGYPVRIDGHRSKWERNDFTDDTDQMLLILQSLEQTQDGRLHAANFSKRLKEWSNIGFPELDTPPRGIGFTVGSTLSHPEFKYNPHKAAFDVSAAVWHYGAIVLGTIWNSKGRTLAANGAVMRTAVLGIESFWDEARVVENALAAAKVTHADPRSIVSALVSSVLISRLLRGGGQDATSDAARVWNPSLGQQGYREGLLDYLRRGSDINGQQSADPTYEIETEKTMYRNKDGKAILSTESSDTGLLGKISSFITGKPSSSDGSKKHSKVVLRDDIGWAGINNVGEDDAMGSLARSVVADYSFLLLETDVAPSSIVTNKPTVEIAEDHRDQLQSPITVQEKWAKELESHCFPKDLEQLELGDQAKMGYTFKCIGIGYYASTRREDPAPTDDAYKGPSGLFRGIIEQVTLEAGDADTNGAVVGSLLGARFGVEEGIPHSWWKELRHYEWLWSTVNQFAERVLSVYDERELQRLQDK